MIKFHLESLSSFELEIDKKTYDFFDGNENDIKLFKKNYLEKNITLESFSFKIKTVEDILKNISKADIKDNMRSGVDKECMDYKVLEKIIDKLTYRKN